ncbi:MAG TPA: hypothetical protein VLT15_06380 [Acidimicrobiia bacterium]|nr:hypothetical protein [Acidimicrobiia bacterium]
MTGLKPREFVWVIAGRLAVCERIGGYGFQHRRVRREEEIAWLRREAKITSIVSLLPGNQNVSAYEDAGFKVLHCPFGPEDENGSLMPFFSTLDEALKDKKSVVLVHRDTIDEGIGGLLAGYLVHAGYLDDPIIASAVIQEILGKPLGPKARAMIRVPERFTRD